MNHPQGIVCPRRCWTLSRIVLIASACLLWLSPAIAAQEQITISSCPGQSKLPVTFEIDCFHVKDAATRELCHPFIENQACKVFPAYRKITGINLEQTCKSIKFTIYDEDNWPHPKGEGGLALHCAVDYLAKYSLQSHPGSKIGPYDVHDCFMNIKLRSAGCLILTFCLLPVWPKPCARSAKPMTTSRP
jgi:hypothetical protein